MHSHIIAIVIIAISAIGTITYNAKKVGEAVQMLAGPYRWAKTFVMAPDAIITLAETQAAHGRALERIVKELTPNGGLSMRDAIARIEANSIADRQRNRALLLDVSTGIFEADQTGAFAWVNRTLCRMVERVPDEILGHGWESCIAPEDRERVLIEWNRCVAAGREFVMEVRFVGSSGESTAPTSVHSYVLRGDGGQVIGFQGVCRQKQENS